MKRKSFSDTVTLNRKRLRWIGRSVVSGSSTASKYLLYPSVMHSGKPSPSPRVCRKPQLCVGWGWGAAYIFSSASGFKYELLLHASFPVFLFCIMSASTAGHCPTPSLPRFAIGGSAAGVRPQRAQAAEHSQPDTPPRTASPLLPGLRYVP